MKTAEEILSPFVETLQAEVKRLREILDEARFQIEYLHGKFQETGTGNSVISKINQLLKTNGDD